MVLNILSSPLMCLCLNLFCSVSFWHHSFVLWKLKAFILFCSDITCFSYIRLHYIHLLRSWSVFSRLFVVVSGVSSFFFYGFDVVLFISLILHFSWWGASDTFNVIAWKLFVLQNKPCCLLIYNRKYVCVCVPCRMAWSLFSLLGEEVVPWCTHHCVTLSENSGHFIYLLSDSIYCEMFSVSQIELNVFVLGNNRVLSWNDD